MNISARTSRSENVSRDLVEANSLPALFAGVLGLILVFGAGFAQTQVLHTAAHDARHSAGFPCH